MHRASTTVHIATKITLLVFAPVVIFVVGIAYHDTNPREKEDHSQPQREGAFPQPQAAEYGPVRPFFALISSCCSSKKRAFASSS